MNQKNDLKTVKIWQLLRIQRVSIRSFFGAHFSKFGLNTDISGVNPKSPYSIQTWENASQKTSESGYFSCRKCDSTLSEKNNMLYFRSFVSPTAFTFKI